MSILEPICTSQFLKELIMYRIKSSGEIKSQGEVRKMFPNVSLPRLWDEGVLNYLGVDPVFESPTPTTTRYQTAYKDGVEFKNGKWMWAWAIGPVFTEYTDDEGVTHTAAEQQAAHVQRIDEAQAKSVRAQRNAKLTASDWTQVADAPVDKQAWATYRQALRDITAQAEFPWGVQWPTQPE
jgi:hypothetical protein